MKAATDGLEFLQLAVLDALLVLGADAARFAATPSPCSSGPARHRRVQGRACRSAGTGRGVGRRGAAGGAVVAAGCPGIPAWPCRRAATRRHATRDRSRPSRRLTGAADQGWPRVPGRPHPGCHPRRPRRPATQRLPPTGCAPHPRATRGHRILPRRVGQVLRGELPVRRAAPPRSVVPPPPGRCGLGRGRRGHRPVREFDC